MGGGNRASQTNRFGGLVHRQLLYTRALKCPQSFHVRTDRPRCEQKTPRIDRGDSRWFWFTAMFRCQIFPQIPLCKKKIPHHIKMPAHVWSTKCR
jgi:hypothetical protein